ncbi:MAG: hypothetical protein ABIJ96_12685 [Elusimicrobiota bacterium]
MKMNIVLAIIMAMATGAAGCKSAEQTNQLGSYSAASAKSVDAIAATDFAIKAKEMEMRKSADTASAKISLIKIINVQKQVVSGINFRIRFRVNLDGVEKEAEAIVWHQAWRKPEPYRLMSWNWM